MAFGSSPVLDNFNRADGDGLGSNWTEPVFSADTGSDWDISSNQAASGGGSNRSSAYWNPATFGANCEAYVTIATKPGTNGRVAELYARLVNIDGTPGGYMVRAITQAGTDLVRIIRLNEDGSLTQLGADISQEIANGDKLGIECIGDQIAAYLFTGGSWAQLGVRTDSTFGGAGNVGIGTNVGSTRLDDFAAGTVSNTKSMVYNPQRRNMLGLLPR